MRMPDGFLWGGSVSAHQSEGACGSRYGKGESIYDELARRGGRSFANGIDTYHHFAEDAKLLAEMGMNAYRFSLSWSRILPEGDGQPNEQGLAFYDRFIDALLENGIEPIVCLYHFDTPLSLQRRYKGWLGRETVDAFEAYSRLAMRRYGDRVARWIPMNEANGCSLVALLSNATMPDSPEFDQLKAQASFHLALASARVCAVRDEVAPSAEIIGMVNVSPCYPASSSPEDVLAAELMNESHNFDFLNVLARGHWGRSGLSGLLNAGIEKIMHEGDFGFIQDHPVDSLGISYYFSSMTRASKQQADAAKSTLAAFLGNGPTSESNPHLTQTEWGWAIDACGLRTILNEVYRRFELPIYVLESGIGVRESPNESGVVEDPYRIAYFRDQIAAVRSAICEDNVDVRSFLTWAPLDILSSHGEMEKRYGFVYVDRSDNSLGTMRRTKKQSFSWLSKVIASNGEDLS